MCKAEAICTFLDCGDGSGCRIFPHISRCALIGRITYTDTDDVYGRYLLSLNTSLFIRINISFKHKVVLEQKI